MNTIEFYERYNNLRVDLLSLESKQISIKSDRDKTEEYELHREMNRLFADYLGTKIDIFV